MVSAVTKRKTPIIPVKVKVALRVLFEQPKVDLEAAAQAAGLSVYRLREAMKRADVRQWAWHEKRALIDAVCAGNPLALKEIRDTSANDMARVNAIKAAEQMRQDIDEVTRGGPAAPAPGLVIVLENHDGTTRMISASPAPLQLEARRVRERELAAIDDAP
jgi:hypothetical protein